MSYHLLSFLLYSTVDHVASVTAIADKLGVEFALIHRKRNGKSLSAPEHMEILVGDVKDKARWNHSSHFSLVSYLFTILGSNTR